MAQRRQPNDRNEQADQVKRLAIVAMFSDEELMQQLVLKGGNALDLIHGVSTRASFDLDFSIPGDFPADDLPSLQERLAYRLKQAFSPEGLKVFDVTFKERPDEITEDMRPFWGGYRIELKVVDSDTYEQYAHDPEALRRRALPVGPRQSTKLAIEISKYEHCADKQTVDVDGYTVHVYTPRMIVCEKLRAICQQMPEYTQLTRKHQAARARDFLDIHSITQSFPFDPSDPAIRDVLQAAFVAKRVPLNLLRKIANHRDFHRTNWAAVEATVRPSETLKCYDFYFDYVLELVERLQAAGDVEPPA